MQLVSAACVQGDHFKLSDNGIVPMVFEGKGERQVGKRIPVRCAKTLLSQDIILIHVIPH